MLIVAVLFALVLLRWVILAVGVVLLLPRVRDCPACFRSTVRVRRPWLRRLLPWLEWRWCLSCGWEGPGRRPRGSRRSEGAAADERRRSPRQTRPGSSESSRSPDG